MNTICKTNQTSLQYYIAISFQYIGLIRRLQLYFMCYMYFCCQYAGFRCVLYIVEVVAIFVQLIAGVYLLSK